MKHNKRKEIRVLGVSFVCSGTSKKRPSSGPNIVVTSQRWPFNKDEIKSLYGDLAKISLNYYVLCTTHYTFALLQST